MNKILLITLLGLFTLQLTQQQSADCPVKDSLVPVLPNFDGKDSEFPCSYAGLINVKSKSGLFYWYFYNEYNPDLPMTLWLNGGPGSSSMFGLFDENGPLEFFKQDKEGVKLRVRQNNWTQYGHMLFVDQPAGTGFSYNEDGEYIGTEDQVASEFVKFLEEFVAIHTETADLKWNFFGESYAGKYTPAISQAILRSEEPPIKLNKIALIDPLVFGLLQKTSTRNELFGGLGIMDPQQLYQFNSLQQQCAVGINKQFKNQTTLCVNAESYMEHQTKVNDLNISQNPETDNLIDIYFNQQSQSVTEQIIESLHLEDSSKKPPKIFGSDPQVYQAFNQTNDIYGNESLSQIYEILYSYERPVMIMEGVFDSLDGILGLEFYKDYLVDSIGNRQQIKYLNSRGDCASYGYIQHAKGTKNGNKYDFKVVAVQNAGHMIPKDQLLASNFIVDNYYNDGTFCDDKCDCDDSSSVNSMKKLLDDCNGKSFNEQTQQCECGSDYFLADCSQSITKITVQKPLIDNAKLGWNFYKIEDISELLKKGNNIITIGRNQDLNMQVAYYTFDGEENFSLQEPLSVQYFQDLQEVYIHIDDYKKDVTNILGVYLQQSEKSSNNNDAVNNKLQESILIQAQYQNYSTDFKEHYFLIKGVGGFCFFLCLLLVGVGFFAFTFNQYNKSKKQLKGKHYTAITE